MLRRVVSYKMSHVSVAIIVLMTEAIFTSEMLLHGTTSYMTFKSSNSPPSEPEITKINRTFIIQA